MDSFLFNILKWWLYTLAILPFRVLYVISDILFYPLYYVIRYRRKVVRANLTSCFPEKTLREIKALEKQFYHHFCDYIIETVKLMHVSDQEMDRRIRYTNPDILQDLLKNGKSVFLMLGHYGNWEWITSVMRLIDEKTVFGGQIYRPLRNKAADHFFLELRKRFNSTGIPKNDTLREILSLHRDKRQMVIGFIADQTPSRNNLHYWTMFLNRETPVLTGAEKIARKINAAILFVDMKKVKRGYYEATFKTITENAKETSDFEITEKYIRQMELSILDAPQYWLWTHKRWKHKKNAE